MAQAQPRTDKGHLAPHVLLQVCEDESPREEDELTGPQCRRCQAESPSRHPCRPGTIFSWAENPHLQVQKAVDHEPLLLIDTDKNHHVLDFDDVSLRDGNCFRAWRSRFLFILMGPRDLPQRLVTQEAPTGPRPAPLQFRWRDNLHLVRDDFAYLMCAPGDTSWDIKVLTMIDTTGVAHTLAFGTGTDTGCRVEKWRTQTINNTIKSFRRVFGSPSPADDSQHEIFKDVVGSYISSTSGGRFLSLDEHLEKIQRVIVPRLPGSGLRPELSGPNFPDFFRGAISRSPELQMMLRRLPWAGRVDRPFSRDAKTKYLRRLVEKYVATCEDGKNFAYHVYRMWRLYCDALLDYTLPRFRRRLLADAEASRPLARFLSPRDRQYRYGDTGSKKAAGGC